MQTKFMPDRPLSPHQRVYLDRLQNDLDPFANCNDSRDQAGITRTKNVLVRRQMVDSCGRLTNKGREALK